MWLADTMLDTSSGTTAWVDTLGFKHLYNDFRNNILLSITITKLTSVQFNAIPTGNHMAEMMCSVVSLDSPLYSQLVNLIKINE